MNGRVGSRQSGLGRFTGGYRWQYVLRIALAATPLAVALIWGAYFDDSTYASFRLARNLATGRGLRGDWVAENQSPPSSLPYTLALSLSARLGVPLPQAALVLCGLGWGVAAVAAYDAGREMRRPIAAVVSAGLIAFSPASVSTLGTEVAWVVASACVAVASAVKGRRVLEAAALGAVLCIHPGLSTLAFAVLLLVVQRLEGEKRLLWPSLAVAVAVAAYGLAAWAGFVALPRLALRGLAEWTPRIRKLQEESEFYWLFLPFIGLGLVTARRRALWLAVPWSVVALSSGGSVAGALFAVEGALLAGLGIDRGIHWVETQDLFRLDRFALVVSFTAMAALPLGVAEASSLLRRYPHRPVVRQALERQAGEWLSTHSGPQATVLGSERVGFLADRPTFPWDGSATDAARLVSLIEAPNGVTPEYCVSVRSIPWNQMINTTWFQDRYAPLESFASPYEGASPLTVWGYRLRALSGEERRPTPLNVHLPGGVDLLGYDYWPQRAGPGDDVRLTLYLQAARAITQETLTAVQVVSPVEGAVWARRDIVTSGGDPADWARTGEVIARTLTLTIAADVPTGAYDLDVSVTELDGGTVLALYQRKDPNPLDHITLGHLLVPWRGSLANVNRVDASLGNQIGLLGFEASAALSPGSQLNVTLYWEALEPPRKDYVAFVHLLDAQGQLVASHDGPPMDRRYPTSTWLPGDIVPDTHRLVLDAAVPVGTHQLRAGMYEWPTGERLPAWDSQGVKQADGVVVLGPIEVR
jgi:hypothetical protein